MFIVPEKTGLKSALDAIDVGDPPVDEAEQIPLLPLSEMIAPAADGGDPGDDAGRRGPGRPKGSTNKRTQEWGDYILSRYSSPLEVLAQTMSRPVRELADELSCSVADAFKMQILAAKELAPYLHQKMPTAIDLGDSPAALLPFAITADMAQSLGFDPAAGFPVVDVESVEIQEVTETADEKSDNPKSDNKD